MERRRFMTGAEAMLAVKAAGFDIKERLAGFYVTGFTATKNGESYICAHDGTGMYSSDRVDAVLKGNALGVEAL